MNTIWVFSIFLIVLENILLKVESNAMWNSFKNTHGSIIKIFIKFNN